MYTEFIIIYAALAVIIGLLVFILIKLLKMGKNKPAQTNYQPTQSANVYANPSVGQNATMNHYAAQSQPAPSGDRVVFCYKCGNQYSISENRCPHCGAPRG